LNGGTGWRRESMHHITWIRGEQEHFSLASVHFKSKYNNTFIVYSGPRNFKNFKFQENSKSISTDNLPITKP
jgi:hypothetical protein